MLSKVITVFLALFLFFCPRPASAKAIPVDGYAATVNKHVVMVTEVLNAMRPVENQLHRRYRDEELHRKLEEAYEKTLDSLIERALIVDAYENQRQFAVPPSVLSRHIDEIIHNQFNNNRAELNKALVKQGMTFNEWQENINKSIIISYMRARHVDSKVSVSPLACRSAYEAEIDKYRIPEQVETRMIVIDRGAGEDEAAIKYKMAQDVRRRLVKGESFENLAKQVSEGTRAAAGGYVGWIEPGSRRPELAEILADMQPGEISKVIDTGDDYYILKVEALRAASVISFDECRDAIQAEIQKEEEQRVYREWIKRLKQKAYIKKY